MTEGLVFYWIGWIFWIIVTFFWTRSKRRTGFMIWTLSLIMFSDVYIDAPVPLSIGYAALTIGAFILYLQLSRKVYHFFVSFALMSGYVASLMWAHHAPVWLVADRSIIIPMGIFFLSVILAQTFYSRLACGLLGILLGELLYSVIMAGYGFPEMIGDMQFLDIVVVFVLFLAGASSILYLNRIISYRRI